MVEPGPRRRLRWRTLALGTVTVLGAFASLCSAWVMLPRWCPEFTIAHSPWVEPVVRAAAVLDAPDALGERVMAIHNEALPGLRRAYRWGDVKSRSMAL